MKVVRWLKKCLFRENKLYSFKSKEKNDLIDFNVDGNPLEEIVKFYKKIGYGGKKKLAHTDVVSIRYSKTETHAFPVDRMDYKRVLNRKKNCIGLTARHDAGVSRTGFALNIHFFLEQVKKFVNSKKS